MTSAPEKTPNLVVRSWDDGIHSGVKQVVITHDPGIYSIQILYDDNGTPCWSGIHGNPDNGNKKTTVTLDDPNEFLTSIFGYKGGGNAMEWNVTNILSLAFVSNKRIYGPFGSDKHKKIFGSANNETYFSLPCSEHSGFGGKIVGFFGKIVDPFPACCLWGVDNLLSLGVIGIYKLKLLPPPKSAGLSNPSQTKKDELYKQMDPSQTKKDELYKQIGLSNPSQTKKDELYKQIFFTVSDNQVSGNGDHSGSFSIGNTINIYQQQYYYFRIEIL